MTDEVYRLYRVYISPQSSHGQSDGSVLAAVRANCVDTDQRLGKAGRDAASPAWHQPPRSSRSGGGTDGIRTRRRATSPRRRDELSRPTHDETV